jgi:hypothetical protein
MAPEWDVLRLTAQTAGLALTVWREALEHCVVLVGHDDDEVAKWTRNRIL